MSEPGPERGSGPSAGRGERAVRVALVGAGAAGVAVGAEQLLAHVPAGDWWPVVRWAAGGVLVHDLVLAPLAVALGALALHRGGRSRSAPLLPAPLLRGALLLAASLAVLVLVQHATSAPSRNPTVLPHGTAPGTVVAAGLVLAVLLAGALVALARALRRRTVRRRGARPPVRHQRR